MNKNIVDKFLLLCRQNYFDKITPANTSSYEKDTSKELVNIAKEYFQQNRYDEFAGFFLESQYFVPLWAAHLLLEFGNPPKELVSLALQTITNYSTNPLAVGVANEEIQWLEVHISKYR